MPLSDERYKVLMLRLTVVWVLLAAAAAVAAFLPYMRELWSNEDLLVSARFDQSTLPPKLLGWTGELLNALQDDEIDESIRSLHEAGDRSRARTPEMLERYDRVSDAARNLELVKKVLVSAPAPLRTNYNYYRFQGDIDRLTVRIDNRSGHRVEDLQVAMPISQLWKIDISGEFVKEDDVNAARAKANLSNDSLLLPLPTVPEEENLEVVVYGKVYEGNRDPESEVKVRGASVKYQRFVSVPDGTLASWAANPSRFQSYVWLIVGMLLALSFIIWIAARAGVREAGRGSP